jgi:hypothetical protein
MTHDEELGRRALRRVVNRFVRANVGKVIPRLKSQLLSNGSCHKDKHSFSYSLLLESRVSGKFTPKLLLITFMVGRWVGSLGQVMLDFRILGHITT